MAKEKEHTYPKTQSTEMKRLKPEIMSPATKKTTPAGAHLKQEKGTPYNQAKITSGFLTQESRPGHKQTKNVEVDKPGKK